MGLNFNTQKLQTFIQIIKQIVGQELDKITTKAETTTYGTIMSNNGNNKFNVQVVGTDSVLVDVVNKSFIDLVVGDNVAIKSNNGNLSNGYIALKLGQGTVDGRLDTLVVGNVDYTISDAEYTELLNLLGG